MTDMIKELWYGNIIPQEDGIFNKPEFKELLGYTARHRGELEETLTDKKKELLEKMMDNRNEFDSLAEAAVFAYGFRLGARLMLEVVKEAQICNIPDRPKSVGDFVTLRCPSCSSNIFKFFSYGIAL